ncbi:Regulation of enolase 1 [Paraburkholderia tropica]
MLETCRWLNPPKAWEVKGGVLRVRTDANSDFWRETYYGFTRDSGHCFGLDVNGDFTAQVFIQASFRELYDQAGVLLRIDESNWVKAGAEFSDGETLLGSVLTVGRSDWATGAAVDCLDGFWMRLGLSDGVLRVQYSLDGRWWPMLRLAPFPVAERYMIGMYCCTPERAGLEVVFSKFSVSAPLGHALHDLR